MSWPIVSIRNIPQYENQEVELQGWLYNKRSSGKLHFLQIRDGSGLIQAVVFKGDVSPEVFEKADHLGQETSLRVRGLVRADKRSLFGTGLPVNALAGTPEV